MPWNKLSMADRAKYIALGVKSGITNLNDIKKGYNSFARGGYTEWKQRIKKYKGIDIDNDPTYDYEGFYNSDPDKAWDMMNKDSDAHFVDEYKTAIHPSFSNQSIYSGYKNKFNPKGITGGTWIDDNNYQLSQSQFDNDWDTDRTLEYFNLAESSPVNLYAPNGSTILHGVTVTPQSSALNRSRGIVNKFDGSNESKMHRFPSATPPITPPNLEEMHRRQQEREAINKRKMWERWRLKQEKRRKRREQINHDISLVQGALNDVANESEPLKKVSTSLVADAEERAKNTSYNLRLYGTVADVLLNASSAGLGIKSLLHSTPKLEVANGIVNGANAVFDAANGNYGQLATDVIGIASNLGKNVGLGTYTRRYMDAAGHRVVRIYTPSLKDAMNVTSIGGDVFGVGNAFFGQ